MSEATKPDDKPPRFSKDTPLVDLLDAMVAVNRHYGAGTQGAADAALAELVRRAGLYDKYSKIVDLIEKMQARQHLLRTPDYLAKRFGGYKRYRPTDVTTTYTTKFMRDDPIAVPVTDATRLICQNCHETYSYLSARTIPRAIGDHPLTFCTHACEAAYLAGHNKQQPPVTCEIPLGDSPQPCNLGPTDTEAIRGTGRGIASNTAPRPDSVGLIEFPEEVLKGFNLEAVPPLVGTPKDDPNPLEQMRKEATEDAP
jgi:hypothetical protein